MALPQAQPAVFTTRIAILIVDSFSFSIFVKTRFYSMQVTRRAACIPVFFSELRLVVNYSYIARFNNNGFQVLSQFSWNYGERCSYFWPI